MSPVPRAKLSARNVSAAQLRAAFAGACLLAAVPPVVAQTAPELSNLSRLLAGTKIERIDPLTGAVVPTPGLSSVIDDDVSSGWTPPTGRTLLMVTLPETSDLSNFNLFAPGAEGGFSAFAAPETGDPLQALSGPPAFSGKVGEKSEKPAGNPPQGRRLVIELDLTSTAPLRSVDAVGRPAQTGAENRTVVSPASGEQNAGQDGEGELAEVNFAALNLGAVPAGAAGAALRSLIDGDTATSSTIANDPGQDSRVVFNLAAAIEVKRVSLAFEEVVGTVRFFASDPDNPEGRLIGEGALDGSGKTLTLEAPGITAESVTIEWKPTVPGTPLVVSELGVFAMARITRTRETPDSAVTITVQPAPASPPPMMPPPAPSVQQQSAVPPAILPPAMPVSA